MSSIDVWMSLLQPSVSDLTLSIADKVILCLGFKAFNVSFHILHSAHFILKSLEDVTQTAKADKGDHGQYHANYSKSDAYVGHQVGMPGPEKLHFKSLDLGSGVEGVLRCRDRGRQDQSSRSDHDPASPGNFV